MEQLASLLLHSRTQAHSFHVGVKGVGALSAHLALGTLSSLTIFFSTTFLSQSTISDFFTLVI